MTSQSRTIVIARPEKAGIRLSESLLAVDQELEIVLSPLLRIRQLHTVGDLYGYQGVIFTSENAVDGFPRQEISSGMRAYCVGQTTAEAARKSGFDAKATGENAVSLIEMIRGKNIKGPLMFARGNQVAVDVAGVLNSNGVRVHEKIVYEQVPLTLSVEARDRLRNAPCLVTLFSSRTAQIFSSEAESIPNRNHVAYCLSESISHAFNLTWKCATFSRDRGNNLIQHILEHARSD